MEEKKNCKVVWCVVALVVLLGIGVGLYIYKNKEKPVNNIEVTDKEDYLEVSDSIKALRSELNITEFAKVNKSSSDISSGLVFVDVIEPDFQFETHYLFVFTKDGKLVFEARDFKDKDNDNNRYKYNGTYEYNGDKKTLTFNTTLFLGESDEATGTAFNDKGLSELTKKEKTKLGNYSDVVKYTYKYENKKMTFVKKEELSKLKDNEYYKNELN